MFLVIILVPSRHKDGPSEENDWIVISMKNDFKTIFENLEP